MAAAQRLMTGCTVRTQSAGSQPKYAMHRATAACSANVATMMVAILPGMQLDVVLEHPGSGNRLRRIVIDSKFTSVTKEGHYRAASLQSGYVYQIYAYLMSQDAREPDAKSEGPMLHPAIGDHLDEEMIIQGHCIRSATVDLMANPRIIANELLAAISPSRPAAYGQGC